MDKFILFALFCFAGYSSVSGEYWPYNRTSIAVVTSDKGKTRLRLIRHSPRSLVHRLNSMQKGTKSEDIGQALAKDHQWLAVDFDYRRKEFFVFDRKTSNLLVINDQRSQSHKLKLLYRGLSSRVMSIAYDWLRRALYWGDPTYGSIFRLDFGHMCTEKSCNSQAKTGKRRRGNDSKRGVITSVVGDMIFDPTSVAVDPIRRTLFWSDSWGSSSIQFSSLDGDNRALLVGGIINPSGLTLDYDENVLYWIEQLSGLSVIKACNLNIVRCQPERVISVYQSRLFDLDFHQGFLIASDLAVNRLVIYDGGKDQVQRHAWAGTTHGICVAARDRQPWAEIPASEPPRPKQQPLGLENIEEHGAVFISSVGSGIWATSKMFAMGPGTAPLIPLVKEVGVAAMAIDIIRSSLFYYSKTKQSIYRIKLTKHISPTDNYSPRLIVSKWLDDVTALAVDWTTGNLYWTDLGYKRIMVSTHYGDFPSTLHHKDITAPRDLIVHSIKRLLFWIDQDPKQPRIERSDLDGSNRIVIDQDIFYERPHALTLDYFRDRLYWSDGPYVCSANLMGMRLESCKKLRDYSTSDILSMDIMHAFIVSADSNGGIKLTDVAPDESLARGRSSNASYHSQHVFMDVLYYHNSRQLQLKNPCASSPASFQTREPRNSYSPKSYYSYNKKPSSAQKSSRVTVNDLYFDTKSFEYITTATTASPQAAYLRRREMSTSPATPPSTTPTTTTVDPNAYIPPPGDLLLGRDVPCSQLCLIARDYTQCACATGYWLRRDGTCSPGVVEDEFFIFADLKTGLLFRQFALLPDYYAFAIEKSGHAIDLVLCTVERRIYWVDASANSIHSVYVNGSTHNVVYTAPSKDFNMTKIVIAPRSRLLYILTSSGDVAVLSLVTRYLRVIARSSDWAVLDMAVDENKKQVFMTATRKRYRSKSNVTKATLAKPGLVLQSDMDGENLAELYNGEGQPWSIALHTSYLVWTDMEQHRIYQVYIGEAAGKGEDLQVVSLVYLGDDASPNDLITVGEQVYFTDRTRRAIMKVDPSSLNGAEEIGFPFLNDISGLAYFNASCQETPIRFELENCTGIVIPKPGNKATCLCQFDVDSASDEGYICQDASGVTQSMAEKRGLCLVKREDNAIIEGGEVDSFVLLGQKIKVTCKPGYKLTPFMDTTNETRICQGGNEWSVQSRCISIMKYTVHGNNTKGYVIFKTNDIFIVPPNVKRLDVIAIGGGGGGWDGCRKHFYESDSRAGKGGTSKFGTLLRAYGGQGGSRIRGGLGGKGRTLFGGHGQNSSECLGGGAAGQTTPPNICQLGSTACPFCGAGGAPRACSTCSRRYGGCSGNGHRSKTELAAADDYGGGATGIRGGFGGGGGGFSRRSVRVKAGSHFEVQVGSAGTPSARPAGEGVVVVGWGSRLEQLVDQLDRRLLCRRLPVTYVEVAFDKC